MSRYTGRGAQRLIQGHVGFVSVAALLCLSGTARLAAQAPETTQQAPATQQTPATEQAPAQPVQAPAETVTPTTTPSTEPATTTPAAGTTPSGGGVTLPTVQVEATQPRAPRRVAPQTTVAPAAPLSTPPAPAVAAGPTDGYQATQSGITRMPVPLRDTPQTVNVVTQQIIQEQRAVSVEDALRGVPGITFSAGEGGQQGDGPIIRGFVARGDLFRDGIRDPGWYTRDLFNADRVEVYKGPSAFLFGRGATGGAINTVSKLPLDKPFYGEGVITATTGPGVRAEVDTGGKSGIWSGRISAMGQDLDTPTRDNIFTKRWGMAPSVSAQLGEQTKATLAYIYQGEEGPSDYGFTYLPQPAYSPLTGARTNPGYYGNGAPTPPIPAPRSNWFGIPTGPLRDLTKVETHILTGKLEHELDNGVKFTNATRYMSNDRFARVTAPRSLGDANNVVFGNPPPANYPPQLMTIGRERRERETDNTYLVNQSDMLAKFNTDGIRHTLNAGVEVAWETRTQDRRDLCDSANVACRANIFSPYTTASPTGGPITVFQPIDTTANNFAVYASDQAKINEYFDLLGSVRGDYFSTDYNDPNQAVAANRHLTQANNLFSYRAGAVGHPSKNSSVYVVYGNSYNPSAEQGTIQNLSASKLAPEHAVTIEAGAKADVLKDKLSLAGAVFRIEKTNLRINDPTDNTVQILDGVARVDGVELSAIGKVTDQWSVFAGYSYLSSVILDTRDRSILNRHLPNTPTNNLSLWTTYELTKKLTIGGGATYQSMAWANQGNTAYVPEFWKFDAMASYKVTDKATLQLNVYNITNELYYSQYFGANVVPASGRWASLTYRQRW